MMSFFDQFATVADVIHLKHSDTPEHGELLKVSVAASFEALAEFLSDHHIGAALLYDHSEKVIGIISERDLIRQIALHGREAFNLPMASMMTQEIMDCELSDSLKAVAARMAHKHIRHIAVKGKDGEYVGVISSSDIELFAGDG